MSQRFIQFNPTPSSSSGVGSSAGQPIEVPSRAVVVEPIVEQQPYPRPGYPPMTIVQKRMRDASGVDFTPDHLSYEIYKDMKIDNEMLKENLRKEKEKNKALEGAYADLKQRYDQLQGELATAAKPISATVKNAVRGFYDSLPNTLHYITEEPLKSEKNQQVLQHILTYVSSHFAYKDTNHRDLRKYLERQFYTKKTERNGIEGQDFVEQFLRKRQVAKSTRKNAKTKSRKEIYNKYKDQDELAGYPNGHLLLEAEYMSEEEDMYHPEKYEDAKRILQEQEPTRTSPFSQKEIMSVLCLKKIDFFEVRVPSYRSQRYTAFLQALDSQIAIDKANKTRSGNSNVQPLERTKRISSMPIPASALLYGVADPRIAWAFSDVLDGDYFLY